MIDGVAIGWVSSRTATPSTVESPMAMGGRIVAMGGILSFHEPS